MKTDDNSGNSISGDIKNHQSADIVLFPEERIVRHFTIEGVKDSVVAAKMEYIGYLVDRHCDALMCRLAMAGVNINSPNALADTVMIYEAVKSALYRLESLPHPLQNFVDENYTDEVVEILNDAENHHDDGYKEQNDDEAELSISDNKETSEDDPC